MANAGDLKSRQAVLRADASSLLLQAAVTLLRQQDSDLRMLALVEERAEDMESRSRRITDEIARHHPDVELAALRNLVDETTAVHFEKVAEAETLDDVVEAVYDIGRSLASKLSPGVDAERLAGRLVTACLDSPDSTRMYADVLLGSVAAFDGTLLNIARILASADPLATRTRGKQREGISSSTVELRDDPVLLDAVYRMTKMVGRNGWTGWSDIFEWFNIEFPEQPAHLIEASYLRNAIAHTNGQIIEVGKLRAEVPGSTVETSADVTPELLREVLDLQLRVVVELCVRTVHSAFPQSELSTGAMLGKVYYELLVRKRYEATAKMLDIRRTVRCKELVEERYLQVNEWLALKRLGLQRRYMYELSQWGASVDGTPYEIARSVLTNRPAEAKRTALRMRKAGTLNELAWQVWPLFEGLRD